MARPYFRVKTDGFKSLEKRLEGMSKEVVQEVSDSIDKNIFDINKEQVANVTKVNAIDTGHLRRSNGFEVSQPTYKELFNNADYSAYIEFGLGDMKEIPKGMEEYAYQFKGKGIRKIDRAAKPFFFAPFFKKRTKILRDILTVLSKFGK